MEKGEEAVVVYKTKVGKHFVYLVLTVQSP